MLVVLDSLQMTSAFIVVSLCFLIAVKSDDVSTKRYLAKARNELSQKKSINAFLQTLVKNGTSELKALKKKIAGLRPNWEQEKAQLKHHKLLFNPVSGFATGAVGLTLMQSGYSYLTQPASKNFTSNSTSLNSTKPVRTRSFSEGIVIFGKFVVVVLMALAVVLLLWLCVE